MCVDHLTARAGLWLRAARPFSFTASATPVLIGGAAVVALGYSLDWLVLFLFLTAAVLIHAATNYFGDYFDFIKGVDKDYTHGSSGVLLEGSLKPYEVLMAGFLCLCGAAVFGLWLVFLKGFPILLLGLAGVLGGYLYTGYPVGYKYRALGDAAVFLFMGVFLVCGSFYAVTEYFELNIFWISLPIASLVAAILHGNNLRDIKHDREANVQTLASVCGHSNASMVYYGYVVFPYLVTMLMISGGILSWASLAVFLSAPLAYQNISRVFQSKPDSPESLADLDQETAKLHLSFGVLQISALIIQGAFV